MQNSLSIRCYGFAIAFGMSIPFLACSADAPPGGNVNPADKSSPNGASANSVAPASARPRLPLHALTVAEFEAFWQIDMEAQNQPLRLVLQQFISKVPLWRPEVLESESSPPALDRKISLTLSQVSALEAIERACKAAGVYPEYDVDGSGKEIIRVHPGPRGPAAGMPQEGAGVTKPAELTQFPGPFAVTLLKLEQDAPYTTGHVTLGVMRPPLPEPVMELSDMFPYDIVSVTAAGGVDLKGNPGTSSFSRSASEPSVMHRRHTGRELKNLLRGVTAIEELRGRVKLIIPTAVKTIWFDRIESNWAMDQGETTIVLNQVNQGPQRTYLQYSVRQPQPLYGMKEYGFDKAGAAVKRSDSSGSWGDNGHGQGSATFEGEVAQLAIVVVTKRELFQRDFVFANLPLTQSAKQPAAQEELNFANHATPLSINVIGLRKEKVFHKAQLKVANHSNKDVRAVEIVMNYLDAQGQLVGDHNQSLRSKEFGRQSLFLRAGEELDLEENALFFPDQGAKIIVLVKQVQFADGTEWKVAKDKK